MAVFWDVTIFILVAVRTSNLTMPVQICEQHFAGFGVHLSHVQISCCYGYYSAQNHAIVTKPVKSANTSVPCQHISLYSGQQSSHRESRRTNAVFSLCNTPISAQNINLKQRTSQKIHTAVSETKHTDGQTYRTSPERIQSARFVLRTQNKINVDRKSLTNESPRYYRRVR